MNRFSKTGLTLLFILVLFMPSYIHADPPTLNIPPTNAFDKIHTDNATVSAQNFSMPIIFKGDNGISIHGNNATHTIIINGTNCTGVTVKEESANRTFNTVYKNTSGKSLLVSIWVRSTVLTNGDVARGDLDYDSVNPPTAGIAMGFGLATISNNNLISDYPVNALIPNNWFYELVNNTAGTGSDLIIGWAETQDPLCGAKTSLTSGTYNQTLANNTPININGNRINFINGTGNPVHIENSNSGQQVNVTISSSGASGVTQLNGFAGKINLTRTYSNNTEIINDTGHLQISIKPVVVLTNGSKQTFTKSLDLGGPTNNQDIFDDIGIVIRNPLHSKAYTISAGAITQNTTLNLPIPASSTDTFAVLGNGGLNQTFSGKVNFTATSKLAGLNAGTVAGNPTNLKTSDIWYDSTANKLRAEWNNGPFAILADSLSSAVSNKQFFDTSVFFENAATTSKQLKFSLAGSTASTILTINTAQTTSQSLNIPNLVSTDSFFLQVAQNQTSDANAIANLPISNHRCATYFVTGNSTFRLICNFNGIAHVLGKQ